MSDDLSRMSDAELATYQSGWKARTQYDILAEREWQRRMVAHELHEQFQLEERLSQANQAHAAALALAAQAHAERLSANTRWWSLAAAVVGVLGTLAGAWLSKPDPAPTVTPTEARSPQQPTSAVASSGKAARTQGGRQ
jgi:hypothetical protein